MNKEEPYRNQAERLKRKIEKTTEPIAKDSHLPPRSEVHRNKKKKTKKKLKYPLIRLLVLFFILLPIIFSIYSYMGGKFIGVIKTSITPNKGYETVNFDNSKNDKVKPKEKNSNGKDK